MRELHVIGLDAGGKNVLLREKGTGEQYAVPADERLRAASRGDLTRLGQIEVETSSSLRPREIQARIRLGATVADVAAEAGVSESRIERFAHPVLLERSNVADLARKGHPVRADGPAEQSLDEIITAAFRARGIAADAGAWDAWRNEDGEWIVQLGWQAGHTDNTAHWRLHRDTHGGTLTALDDDAADLVDPDTIQPLRPLTAVSEVERSQRMGIHGPVVAAAETRSAAESTPEAPAPAPSSAAPSTASYGSAPSSPTSSGAASSGPVSPASASAEHAAAGESAASAEHAADGEASGSGVGQEIRREEASSGSQPQDALIPEPDRARAPRSRKNKPAMPSWEDVLLGVRSNAGG